MIFLLVLLKSGNYINNRIIEAIKEIEQLSQTPEVTRKNLIKITGKTLKLRYEIYLENGGKEKVENRKKENIILVKKTNNKILLKEALLWIFQIITLLIFSFIFAGFERASFYFPFFIKLGILALVINKVTFPADENLEIAKDKIILKFRAFGIVFKKHELPNDNNINFILEEKIIKIDYLILKITKYGVKFIIRG